MDNNYWLFYLLSFFAGLLIASLILPGVRKLLIQAGFLRPNYRSELIPAGAGLIFFLASPVIAGLYLLFFNDQLTSLVFLLAITSFTCLGLVDDIWGSRDTGGLAGHVRAFFVGRLTTGFLKAFSGFVIALFLSCFLGPFSRIPINALVIVLSANAVNLLDLRPGRAGKGSVLIALILFALGGKQVELLLLAAVTGILTVYLKDDLKARYMMGDAGSNPLGAILGISVIWTHNETFLLIYLFLLILFHLYTEKNSLTVIIAGNRFLSYLDRLGRGEFMIRIRAGRVKNLCGTRSGLTELEVDVEGKIEMAINYDRLTGPVQPGDEVSLNTTGVYKQLGTGGFHFVMANLSGCRKDITEAGHIMKLRYTPGQLKVLSVEETEHPQNHLYRSTRSLNKMPVIVGSLHSMLGPAAAVIARLTGGRVRVVYMMTDGAALPLDFSRLVIELKEKGLLAATVTCDHAFGGDYEAINVYSGLLAARGAAGADIVIAAMGPGIVGTSSEFGHTGLEQGELVNAVNILGGCPVAIPRLSFADQRERHRGISHHTRTALGRIALSPCVIPLPQMDPGREEFINQQLVDSGLASRHRVVFLDAAMTWDALREYSLTVTTMGRTGEQDPEFFLAAGAAGIYAVSLLSKSETRQEDGLN